LDGGADASELPPEIQEKIYRPREHGFVDDVEIQTERPQSYSGGQWELVAEDEAEIDGPDQ
jgi:hypothetical protein